MLASLDEQSAQHAAKLRVQYNLGLLDALQLGAALVAGCDAFLTNDAIFHRITEIKVIIIDDLES